MATAEAEVISRIHDAINRWLADRIQNDQLIRKLQAENLQLRHELAALTPPAEKNGACLNGADGGEHVARSDSGASMQVRG